MFPIPVQSVMMYLSLLFLLIQNTAATSKTDESCSQPRDHILYNTYSKTQGHSQNCERQCNTNCKIYPSDPRFQGRYSFPVTSIPRMDCNEPQAMAAIEKGIPIVLENCSFASSAYKWTVDYLDENLKDKDHITYFAKQRRFLFYDEEKLIDNYRNWTPPHEKRLMYFHDFLEMARLLSKANNGTRSYFQSPLYVIDGVSPSLESDINSFDYSWLLDIVSRLGWADEMVNLLLIGMPDVVTPAHYDILENFYVQISGYKRVILFSPDSFKNLYPYPVGHPHDRQTQVNFDSPDFERFPKFLDIEGLEAIMGPGDVMYIPIYWWHYIESERNNMTVSVNFWFDRLNLMQNSKQNGNVTSQNNSTKNETLTPNGKTSLTQTEELALKRKVESMIYENTKDHNKVAQVLKEIIAGRFGFLEKS